jgi:hypothetical protein
MSGVFVKPPVFLDFFILFFRTPWSSRDTSTEPPSGPSPTRGPRRRRDVDGPLFVCQRTLTDDSVELSSSSVHLSKIQSRFGTSRPVTHSSWRLRHLVRTVWLLRTFHPCRSQEPKHQKLPSGSLGASPLLLAHGSACEPGLYDGGLAPARDRTRPRVTRATRRSISRRSISVSHPQARCRFPHTARGR